MEQITIMIKRKNCLIDLSVYRLVKQANIGSNRNIE